MIKAVIVYTEPAFTDDIRKCTCDSQLRRAKCVAQFWKQLMHLLKKRLTALPIVFCLVCQYIVLQICYAPCLEASSEGFSEHLTENSHR